jgi:hypothetical protein
MTAMAPEQTAGIAAGRPQPQTTVESPGGPFIRHTQEGRRLMYSLSGQAYGSIINQPMVASPGYNRGYRMLLVSTAGTYTAGGLSTTSVGGKDWPGSTIQLIQVKDAYGTVLFTGPGYEILNLVPMFSGQAGPDELAELWNLPSYQNGISATAFGWVWASWLPFEFAKAYGVISGANASLLPTLQANINTLTNLLAAGVTITAASTLTFQVEADFYWLPQGAAVVPPGIGTTCQWIFQPCSPTFAGGASTLVQAPRLGGYLTCLAADIRDSTSLRQDNWPAVAASGTGAGARLRLYIDGVPLQDTDMTTLFDDMAAQFMVGAAAGEGTQAAPGARIITRPTGVAAWSRKTALAQRGQGLLETGEEFLSTNPGTQIEFAAAPWGSTGTGPFTVNVVAGQVVPSGILIQGLPEV